MRPIGYAAATSQGEIDYRVILLQPPQRALELFEELYAKGNMQAKSYALVGIHKLRPARFKELYLSLTTSADEVTTMSGCVISDQKLKDVAKQIDEDQRL
jgi:hypothetical protein